MMGFHCLTREANSVFSLCDRSMLNAQVTQKSKEDFAQFTGYIEDIRVKKVCWEPPFCQYICHNDIRR